MAHPCWNCDGECFCHGDIDDVVVSKTPSHCESCGCINDDEIDGFDAFEDLPDDDDQIPEKD